MNQDDRIPRVQRSYDRYSDYDQRYYDPNAGRVSALSIVALVLSIIGITSLIGLVLGIIDLRARDGRNRVCSIIAVVIGSLFSVVTIFTVLIGGITMGKVMEAFDSSSSQTPTAVESSVQTTIVPNLVGKTVLEASDLLVKAGMTAKASYVSSSEYEKDIVISQDIAPGTEVENGTVITLQVSSGQ